MWHVTGSHMWDPEQHLLKCPKLCVRCSDRLRAALADLRSVPPEAGPELIIESHPPGGFDSRRGRYT